jgi:putative nucleotidyltransferase with HDIG domain
VSTNALEVLVKRIEQLPSLPTVVYELIEVCKDPNATMAMVEDVIRADQSLTARLLKLVNSAFFALSSRVSTIHHAAVILGMDALRNTAIAVCTYETLSGCHDNPQFDRRAFWEHAAAVGILSKALAEVAKYKKTDEAFVAGLLHDLGKVVLDKYFPDEFARALAMCSSKQIPLVACEEEVLGFHHCRAGAEVARQWRFPEQLVTAIERHHDPASDGALCAMVALADEMARVWRFGASGNPLLEAVAPFVWEQIRVSEATLRELVENSRDEIFQVKALFSGNGEEAADGHTAPAKPRTRAAGAEGANLLLLTTDQTPLNALKIYLEEAHFDVLAMRPDEGPVPREAECLVVQMADKESAAQTLEAVASRQPEVRSLPSVCVGTPCLPDAVVNPLRGALANRVPQH